MFTKILIANRGEIACRIIRTAKKMGIATVAIYAEGERDSLQVQMADEAVCIGAAAAESYLQAAHLVEISVAHGVQAVHPGYGFLAENSKFAELLTAAGIVFIGPGVDAIRAMGDKIIAKRIAEKAGVRIIPGHPEAVAEAEAAVVIAEQVGYPVMLKASAGGGGKGMRLATNAAECRTGFARATSEAQSSFGDGRIFIEKFITQPRHIEIQLMADNFGHIVTLHERECSIQRRHQKIIEEAPSPFLDETMRAAMSAQAIDLARAVDYRSAGTVEFIVDTDRNFYFLEMNTRLQVEHAVTELICQIDLVEWMIRVANGEPLPRTQEQIGRHGWAIEARVYAENPARNFLPSTGRLRAYRPPPQTITAAEPAVLRIDTGVYEGAEISIHFDPMVAKLVTWGATREIAMTTMARALEQYFIRGIDTNLPFLYSIMHNARFRRGDISTDFIAEEYGEHCVAAAWDARAMVHVVCVLTAVHERFVRRAATLSQQMVEATAGEGVAEPVRDYAVALDGVFHATTIRRETLPAESSSESPMKNNWRVTYAGEEVVVADDWPLAEPIYCGRVDATPVVMQLEKEGLAYAVSYAGRSQSVWVTTPRVAVLHEYMLEKKAADSSRFLLAPMPGLLTALPVTAGQVVKAGQELAIIEAMKMENALTAPQDCTITKCLATVGDTVDTNQPLIEFG